LIWFFQKGFSYRIDDRFQTLEEFLKELARFSDSKKQDNLNLIELYGIFDRAVQANDRNVQAGLLREKLKHYDNQIKSAMGEELNHINSPNGKFGVFSAPLKGHINPHALMTLPDGILLKDNADMFYITRTHYNYAVAVYLICFAVGMEIHFLQQRVKL